MNLNYVAHHLIGAWRLLRGDEDGVDHFDLTEEGFWRSFVVMSLALPAIVIGIASSFDFISGYAVADETFDFNVPLPVYAIVEVVVTYVGWIAYLIAMAPLARAFGAPGRYSVFVISYNWATMLVVLLILPINLMELMGWVSIDIAVSLELLFGLITLVYFWFVATVSLKATRMNAAAIVAAEIFIYVVLGRISNSIYTAFPAA